MKKLGKLINTCNTGSLNTSNIESNSKLMKMLSIVVVTLYILRQSS